MTLSLASRPKSGGEGSSRPRVLIARPRLDCSFKPGPVPETRGEPLNRVLRLFGQLIDQLAEAHGRLGHLVDVEERPLWQFDLQSLQAKAAAYDRVYFPHKQSRQFPIGKNAFYYKNAAFPEWLTVDPRGWGASLSWSPLSPGNPDEADWALFRTLQARIADNVSLFEQPDRVEVQEPGYLLFVCQLPHDETIQFHSDVKVETALAAVLAFAEASGQRAVVKCHPAGRNSMAPLREAAAACPFATWVEKASIHSCIAGASTVYLVNSGVGFEAMLHDKPIVRFGEAEYSAIVPKAEPTVVSLAALAGRAHNLEDYVGFIASFKRRCLSLDDADSAIRIAAI